MYSNTLSISQKTGFKYNSFEVMVLHITLYREKSINVKSSHLYLYNAFNNTNCVKANAQYHNRIIFELKSFSLLNSVMSFSSSVQFK